LKRLFGAVDIKLSIKNKFLKSLKQKNIFFIQLQSGDFRTRTAYYRGGSPPFRRPPPVAVQHQNFRLLILIVKNFSAKAEEIRWKCASTS